MAVILCLFSFDELLTFQFEPDPLTDPSAPSIAYRSVSSPQMWISEVLNDFAVGYVCTQHVVHIMVVHLCA